MRKFISVLLALMLVLSATTVAFSAYNVVDEGALSTDEACADYEGATATVYFQMPNGKNGPVATDDVYVHHGEVLDPDTGDQISPEYDELVIGAGDHALTWYNDYNKAADGKHYAGMYWWGSSTGTDPANWPGYRMEIEDYDNSIFSATIPGDDEIVTAIFNNGVDGGTDSTQDIYYYAAQSIDNNMEGAMEGDYDTLWGDTYNDFDFDGCIYVIDPDQVDINAFSGKQTCGGNWYFYYGNGCYGNYRTDADEFVSAEDNCVNPDHFNEEGEHVGYHADEEPTEAAEPTEAPTDAPEPTEAPTDAPEPTQAAEPTEAEEDTITVYFTNNNNWSEVNAYYWPDGGDWPGTPAEYYDTNIFGQAVYKAVLPATVTGLIFNGDGNQTIDITEEKGYQLVDGAEFYISGDDEGKAVVSQVGVEDPTEGEPTVWEQGYYLTGTVADWGLKEGMMLTDEGDGLYSYGPISLTTNDMLKVVDVNKKGTAIANWYPDGMDNNRTVPVDGEYMVYFRPAGDGTAEDGWEYIPYEGDDSGEDAHGCKRGGYMFKFVGNWVEPTEAEPTEAPTDAPEPTEAPTEAPTDEPEPTPEPKAYVVGNFTNWAVDDAYQMAPNDQVEDYEFCLNLDLDADAQFKCVVVMEGEQFWFPEGMGNNYGENGELPGAGNYNIYFRPNYDGGDDWFYNCIYVASTEPEPTEAPEPTTAPEPTLAPQVGQFYVVGNFTSWAVDEAYVMTLNDAAETEEYIYNTNLTTESQFKVVYVDPETGEQTWLPDGMGNNYGENGEITEDGNYDIYFRPNGDGGDDWFYNVIKVTLAEVQPTQDPDQPTEEPPVIWEQGYYLTGTVADWGLKEGMMLTDEGDGLYSYGPIALTANDMLKVIDVNRKGTGIGNWYPDGMDNNRTVPADGEYMVYFRPNGDGTAEDGWEYIPYEGDGSGEDAHGCKRGGYMFKFVSTSAEPTEAEPTQAPEPTEAEPYTVYAVGNGVGAWLNGISWDPGAEENLMTESDPDVWTYTSACDDKVPAEAAIKFAVNGTWDFNFGIDGSATVENGVEMDAVVNGSDAKIAGLTAASTVTAVLDLSNYDAETQTGAKVTISWTGGDEPVVWEKGYYLTGTIADWGLKEGMMLTDEGDGLYSYGPIALTTNDMIKVIDVNRKGTGIGNWYPDGMDNNRTVPADGEYMVYFRPNGDGTAEDGWEYIPYEGDGSGEDAHGCKRGGYMFKFVASSQPEPAYILGDVDGDGKVTAADASFIQRYDAKMSVPGDVEMNIMNGDVDGDGQITILDATCIQRYLAKIGNYTKWGIGEPVYEA